MRIRNIVKSLKLIQVRYGDQMRLHQITKILCFQSYWILNLIGKLILYYQNC